MIMEWPHCFLPAGDAGCTERWAQHIHLEITAAKNALSSCRAHAHSECNNSMSTD
jgi:hypothetical protein